MTICKNCEESFKPDYNKKIYGNTIWINNFCCEFCYKTFTVNDKQDIVLENIDIQLFEKMQKVFHNLALNQGFNSFLNDIEKFHFKNMAKILDEWSENNG